jgi:hypothetical protein
LPCRLPLGGCEGRPIWPASGTDWLPSVDVTCEQSVSDGDAPLDAATAFEVVAQGCSVIRRDRVPGRGRTPVGDAGTEDRRRLGR